MAIVDLFYLMMTAVLAAIPQTQMKHMDLNKRSMMNIIILFSTKHSKRNFVNILE